jgi:flagellar motility protein MotE (MotC chaperone)
MEKTSKILSEIKSIRDANVESLATVYSKMKPADSAQIINAMDNELAVKIFLKMKPNKVAKILNIVNRNKAVKITEKLALYGLKLNVGEKK